MINQKKIYFSKKIAKSCIMLVKPIRKRISPEDYGLELATVSNFSEQSKELIVEKRNWFKRLLSPDKSSNRLVIKGHNEF